MVGIKGAVGDGPWDCATVGVLVEGMVTRGMEAESTARTGVGEIESVADGCAITSAVSGLDCGLKSIPAVSMVNSMVIARLFRNLRRERCRRIKNEARRMSRACLIVVSNATMVANPDSPSSQGTIVYRNWVNPFIGTQRY